MQYEIIAKQLTLLRDEIGPDHRLVFLEIPQSFYPVPRKSNNYLVETRWRLVSHWVADSERIEAAAQLLKKKENVDRLRRKASKGLPPGHTLEREQILLDKLKGTCRTSFGLNEEIGDNRLYEIAKKYVNLSEDRDAENLPANLDEVIRLGKEIYYDSERRSRRVEAALVVDTIPRQSALNITALNGSIKGFNLGARFQRLFGFGGSFGIRREEERLEQFLQQDHFISGFGKGEQEFGWSFGPMPRSKRIAPGPRTTYAVVLLPATAKAFKLDAVGCYYHRKGLPPGFTAAETSTHKTTSGCVSEAFILTDPES